MFKTPTPMIERHFGKLIKVGQRAGKVLIEVLLAAANAIANSTQLLELGITLSAGVSSILTVVLHGILIQKERRS